MSRHLPKLDTRIHGHGAVPVSATLRLVALLSVAAVSSACSANSSGTDTAVTPPVPAQPRDFGAWWQDAKPCPDDARMVYELSTLTCKRPDGTRHGRRTQFDYATRVIEHEDTFANGKRHGAWVTYHDPQPGADTLAGPRVDKVERLYRDGDVVRTIEYRAGQIDHITVGSNKPVYVIPYAAKVPTPTPVVPGQVLDETPTSKRGPTWAERLKKDPTIPLVTLGGTGFPCVDTHKVVFDPAQRALLCHSSKGEPDGPALIWSAQDVMVAAGHFRSGERHGQWQRRKAGAEVVTEHWRDDALWRSSARPDEPVASIVRVAVANADQASVRARLDASLSRVNNCYARQQLVVPNMAGDVTVVLDGKAVAKVDGQGDFNEPVKKCIGDVVAGSANIKRGARLEVTYKLDFKVVATR